VGVACRTKREKENVYKILIGKPQGKGALGRTRHRWKNRGRAPNLGRVPNLGRCDIFMKEVQPLGDKHNKLKIKERALLFTGELIIPAIGVAVRS
jgi:hypothetical protein